MDAGSGKVVKGEALLDTICAKSVPLTCADLVEVARTVGPRRECNSTPVQRQQRSQSYCQPLHGLVGAGSDGSIGDFVRKGHMPPAINLRSLATANATDRLQTEMCAGDRIHVKARIAPAVREPTRAPTHGFPMANPRP
jgi:hypothetical protein